jgi:hypothetical protein
MTKLKTIIGDVFSVMVDDSSMKCFQLIAFDSIQLNSDVIRAFKKVYSINSKPDLSVIVNDEVEFFAHCVTKFGLKMNLWEKIGNIREIGNTAQILFRDTNDYGSTVGELPVKISRNWHVWHINDNNFNHVGKLAGNNRKAEIGIIVNPYDVLERIKTGKYDFVYPDFE